MLATDAIQTTVALANNTNGAKKHCNPIGAASKFTVFLANAVTEFTAESIDPSETRRYERQEMKNITSGLLLDHNIGQINGCNYLPVRVFFVAGIP